MEEMYANDDYYEGFIKGDVARAYYFGFFIEEICKRDPSQLVFRKGWLNRVNDFKFSVR